MQALPEAVRADDRVVVGKPQFDNRVPADEAALPRGHFFAHHPRVPAAKQMNQPIGRDRRGA